MYIGGVLVSTFTFFIFFKYKEDLTPEDFERARKHWKSFVKRWPLNVVLAGVYTHAWGTPYNGILVIECDNLEDYHRFWHYFRDETRWYIGEVNTVIAHKVGVS